MKDPEFDAEYRRAKRAAFGQCVAKAAAGRDRSRHNTAEDVG